MVAHNRLSDHFDADRCEPRPGRKTPRPDNPPSAPASVFPAFVVFGALTGFVALVAYGVGGVLLALLYLGALMAVPFMLMRFFDRRL